MSLEKRLEALRKASAEKIPEEARAIMHRATEDLRNSGILDGVPKSGTAAPDFRLPTSAGGEVSLAGEFAKGPVILTFFRGSW